VSNQDIDGNAPPETPAGAPGASNGAPASLEQQLEKEREARVLMRERLRTTEALAAESHALRARMAQELERVTADRDRLRTEAAATPPAAAPSQAAAPRPAAARGVEPPLMSAAASPPAWHAADRPLKPPAPARGKGPWGALAMLSVLALGVAAFAWYKGALPAGKELLAAVPPAAAPPAAASPVVAANARTASAAQPVAAAAAPAASTSVASVATAPPSTGATALAPVAPEAQLAAAPPAAGPATAGTAAQMSPADMSARLRKALDGEGIASPVDVEAATGRVRVADPQADGALRQRTDMVIRAVYAGASLPEPQIEHRWLSPMHGARETTASADAPAAAPTPSPSPAPAYEARHAASSRAQEHRRPTEVSVADAEQLTPVLPAGRVTASCMDGLTGRFAARRANLTACMKHSCCSSAANHNSEECRAYARAFPFTCGAG
jgi:hypothetical protein